MPLDAAQFKRVHNVEGTPDPFPSLNDPAPAQKSSAPNAIDTDSQDAFPSLAPSAPANRTVASAWGSVAVPRIRPAASPPQATDSFTFSAIDLSTAGRDGKPATLGEIMKQVMSKYKVKIEASTQQKTRQTTFHIKADSKKELEKSKRTLLALLSPIVTLIVDAPASTVAAIVGPKGVTLKQIRDQTNVKIDIPRRDTLAPNGNGNGNGTVNGSRSASGAATPLPDEEEEEPTIPVTITGPQPLAEEAQDFIKQIIASRMSKVTRRVRDIPAHVVPFVKASRSVFVAAAQGVDVNLTLNSAEREVTVAGDRETVVRVIEAVKDTIAAISSGIISAKITLPKRQHHLLVGKAVEDIMTSSKCSVVVPSPEDFSEDVTIWGKPDDIGNGFSAAMAKANSQYIHEFPLPGPISLSKQLLTYMTRTNYPESLSAAHLGVTVFMPPPARADTASVLNLDIVGEKPAVDAAVRQVSELMGKLIGATKEVRVDWLVHKVITSKNAKKIKQLHEAHNVIIFFPPEADELSSVLLVYDPTSPSASPSPIEKAKHLDDAEKELIKFARDAADVKSETVAVDRKWHDAVVGKGGTTLNAIIGEENTLSIKVGAEVGDSSTEDVILVRGASSEVDRAVKEINQIVEDAKNDQILSGFTVEFEIDREYVGRIVGSQGSGVNKHRNQLGVKIDFSDDGDDGGKDSKKRKVHSKSKVQIVGRKENVEEARRRILSQVERLADETSEVLKIPNQYHPGLIGQGGKYVIRLEEKYGVKITFPREWADGVDGKTREPLKLDEVLVKGGRKGVADAKSELMDAVEFDKQSNNVVKFAVSTRAIPRILGKGGVTINEIKDDTGAQIDLDKNADDASTAQITCRGSKKAITAAKDRIQAIADQVSEEVTATLKVESKFHRTLIGSGGQGLKDLIVRCGGPSDTKVQAGLVRFPRQGEEPNDEVRLRGDPKLVNQLKVEIERVVAELRDRVTKGVDIPAGQHRALIGRGGRNLIDFQSKFNVQVQYPGSHSYWHADMPENNDELADVPAENLVKVSGPRASVEKAVVELQNQTKAAPPEGVTETLTVPLKYHHAVSQQGNLFRTLRSFGVQVDQSAMPQKTAVPTRPVNGTAAAARIDDADDAANEIQWEVVPNYQDAEEGDSEWSLKARDQAGLEKAKKTIHEAVERAEAMTHVGFLTLADRSSFPRIVGSKGANIVRLHNQTGADITVSRENNTIVIMGDESSIVAAKEAILKIAAEPARRGPRNH